MEIKKTKYFKRIILSIFFISQVTFATSYSPPDAFIEVTENQKYAFVMIPRKGFNLTGFEQSGLYKLNDLKEPIWAVDWYSTNVIPNQDGQYLVRFGTWRNQSPKIGGALSFYKSGKLIKFYNIDDLVKKQPKVERRWPIRRPSWIKKRKYMEDAGALYLETIDMNEYVFSIFTGELINKNNQKYQEIIQKAKLLSDKKPTKRKISNIRDYDFKVVTKEVFDKLPNSFTDKDLKLIIKEFAVKRVTNKTSIEFSMLPRIYFRIIRTDKVKKYKCEDNKICYLKL